jgi:dienelactone hydrolase
MNSTILPSAIGGYEDWAAYARSSEGRVPVPGELADVLAVPAVPATLDVRVEREFTGGDVTTAELSWQLGYGPRTRAYYLRPAGEEGPLPGVLYLHCHSGNKWLGADRLVDLGEHSLPEANALRAAMYDGRAPATALAARGFAVLAHDTFAWGSRRFTLDPAPGRSARHLAGQEALWAAEGTHPTEELRYNALAADHENTVAKAATLIGTTFAGMVAHDDLAALNVLSTLPGVDATRLGSVGLSGGGGRSMMLAALSPRIRSHVISCMMTTFASLLPSYLDLHSWLMHTPGLWQLADWPLVPFTRSAPGSLLVQYARGDRLFPLQGMRDADALITSASGSELDYTASWSDGDHAMTRAMQDEIAAFFTRTLASASRPGFDVEADAAPVDMDSQREVP